MKDKVFDRIRLEIRNEHGLSVLSGKCGAAGIFTTEVYHTAFLGPICVVWFNFCANDRIQVLNSYVDERLRRCGLRTMVHKQMLEWYPNRTIVSSHGTKSGQAWMKAVGYKQTEAGWEFKRKEKV